MVSPATVCVKTNTSTFRFARERCSPIRSMKLETLQLECRVQYHSVQPRLNVTTVTEVRPVCCTVSVRWREIFRVVAYGDHGCGGVQAHRSAYLSASVSLREHRWRLLWLKCPINPLLRPENWGKKFRWRCSSNVYELFSAERVPEIVAKHTINKQNKTK